MTTYSFYAIEETFRVPDEGAIIAVRPTEVTLTFDNDATALGFRTDLDRSEYDGLSFFTPIPIVWCLAARRLGGAIIRSI